MTFSTEMKAVATELIKDFGTTAAVECVDGVIIKGAGVVVNSTTNDGPQGRRNIKVCYFQGSDKGVPTAGAIVTVGGKNWSIINVQDINPDGKLVVVFKMEVEQ